MGTRADFYVGRGETAEWLGSVAFDGYPDGNPEPILGVTTEDAYRAEVERVLDEERDHATLPEMGWPWPWEDSGTTDFAYAWDDGVWVSSFGHSWVKAAEYDQNDERGSKDAVFPDMTESSLPPTRLGHVPSSPERKPMPDNSDHAHKQHDDTWAFMYECDECRRIEEGFIEETYREALERIDDVLTNPQLWMFGPEDVARTIARKALGR